MHYTKVDNLVPYILAAQGDNEAMSELLEMFSRDFDREAAYGKNFIDPDLRQELQIKFVYIVLHFDVDKYLALASTRSELRSNQK